MKVLMLNGSSNLEGCTYTALCEIGKVLNENGIEYEIFQLGSKPIMDCMGCGKCRGNGCIFDDDNLSEFLEKAKEADGFAWTFGFLDFLSRAKFCHWKAVWSEDHS